MRLTLAEKFWRLEHDPAWTTILLPVDPGHAVTEEILVERIGDDRLRIASSPGMVEGLAADDIIGPTSEAACGYRLISRGGNLCVHLYTQAEHRDRISEMLEQKLSQLDGWLDGTMGETGLCFTIPLQAGFENVEAAMHDVVGDEWYFSNVYDMETDEPLNWWLEEGV